ncbi:MAG TPA: hypothetical protein VF557_18375 [Jatrophihabitans sp.]|jgi:hypothetical protein|uniref:hypothetical protein n=1 Tax=Jatrophihabitans sp. TaxID=1932789 RepID=UPI002F1E99E8
MADLRFAAYVQGPLGEAIQATENMGVLPAAAFAPAVTLVGPQAQTQSLKGPEMRLLGPGDIQGLAAGTVVRAEPSPGAADVEPNYLAAVEVSPVELPWVLTPARATDGRLRPWLVLVVLDASRTLLTPGEPLPSVEADVSELPDLGDSWGWAHVQRTSGAGELTGGGQPSAAAIARLICPRHLKPGVTYRACLVPSFASGVAAGLGDPQAHQAPHEPAWDVASGGSVRLPVYYSWTFTTGPEGDFEQLVRRLRPADTDALQVSSARAIDVRAPWSRDAALADSAQLIGVQGALVPFGAAPTPDPVVSPETLAAIDTRLRAQLDEPAQRILRARQEDTTGSLAPPLYGGRHVCHDLVESGPAWLAQLNTDIGNRIAAGLGAEYVRAHQEDLMARAWAQVGAIREANRLRAVVELTTEVAARVHDRHVAPLLPGELLALAAPASARVRTTDTTTLATEVRMSRLTDGAASSAFARRVRPSGKLAQRTGVTVGNVVPRALAGEVTVPAGAPVIPAPLAVNAAGSTALSSVAAANQLVAINALARVAAVNDQGAGGGALVERIGGLGLDSALMTSIGAGDLGAVVDAIAGQADPIAQMANQVLTDMSTGDAFGSVSRYGVAIEAAGLAGRISAALHPGASHWSRLESQTALPDRLVTPAPSDPVMAYPEFRLPTALALLSADPEWFLPGLGALPMNQVALLQQNGPFIESYLVGINHEMMRELLWREYPTDRRGTPFQRFWPRPDGSAEIAPINTWTDSTELGRRLLNVDGLVVLLIRADVLRRYPDLVVTAVPTGNPDHAGGHYRPDPARPPVTPTFVIKVDESTNAYGFEIPEEQLTRPATVGSFGWFFVLAEHSFRIRFGFDEAPEPPTPPAPPEPVGFASWNDARWPAADGSQSAAFVPVVREHAVAGLPFGPPPGLPDGSAGWNRDAADIARITLQRPFRVAIQAEILLPPTGGG